MRTGSAARKNAVLDQAYSDQLHLIATISHRDKIIDKLTGTIGQQRAEMERRDKMMADMERDHKVYRETAEEIHGAYINAHNERHALLEQNAILLLALEQIERATSDAWQLLAECQKDLAREALAKVKGV